MMFVAAFCKKPGSDQTNARMMELARYVIGDKAMVRAASPTTIMGWRGPVVETDHAAHQVVATGVIFEYDGRAPDSAEPGRHMGSIFDVDGIDFVRKVAGQFACAILAKETNQLFIARDHLGIEPLYFGESETHIVFSTSAKAVAVLIHGGAPRIDNAVVCRFLCFNYNPGRSTIWEGVRKFPPGHHATIQDNKLLIHRYWRLSFAETLSVSEPALVETLRSAIAAAVQRRAVDLESPAVFVSGGLDSSTVLALLAQSGDRKLRTFSYRCRGQGFDESHYARLMAESVNSEHVEVEYRPENVDLMRDLVGQMNEPFCDVGINIATALLGRAAANVSTTVFTGDGGDELFGGHPIYEADKVARFTDRAPNAIVRPLAALLAMLPDSDKKKTVAVKLKRFGESLRFPRELRTHRWRLYYVLEDLQELLTRDLAESIGADDLFGDVIQSYKDADSDDYLDQTLFSDYQTIVDFYLRRNDLNRYLGVEARYPFFDIELVELCAKIPSNLKINGWFDTKYIMKKAIEPWLPNEIVHRKDKLGHSIPLKNWLRTDSHVKTFVSDLLSRERLQNRGIANPEYVTTLWDEHMTLRANHSHRLWALAMFELWMQSNVDTAIDV